MEQLDISLIKQRLPGASVRQRKLPAGLPPRARPALPAHRFSGGAHTGPFRSFAWLLPFLVLVLGGCRVAEQTAKLPGHMLTTVASGTKPAQPDPAMLETELQRYADEFTARMVAALDDYARAAGTPDARSEALRWKINAASAVVNIASRPNPTANLVDFLTLATVLRMTMEERSSQPAEGRPLHLWLETSRSLEADIWRLAAKIFTPAQQEEMRDSIRKLWESNAGARSAFFARPEAFSTLIRQRGRQDQQSGSVFALVGLDPMSGLDPAVREVTRTRLFAERAMYVAERMPTLLRWQLELLSAQLLENRQVATVLTNVTRISDSADRLSRATESASQTLAQMPDRITAERRAILDALEAQEGKLRQLSTEAGQTLAAGEKMSTSLNTTLTTFDLLMQRFGVGEPGTNRRDTNTPPFNILDYARTAEQIAAMAGQLDALVNDTRGTLDSPALDKRITELNQAARQAKADAKSVLNHAFVLGAGWILLAFGCAAGYRWLGRAALKSPCPPNSHQA